ncbi:small serum protein 2-like [Python bivittatus]|uniref:Small serum protein 2-like n=1 Tax=Python bivittatus TaxID=176946 RepID=A0A9F5IGT0_PYTBI|nr:small serum protein 2-like [Python bivittatus]
MRVFFSLIIFSFTLATCQEACWFQPNKVNLEGGNQAPYSSEQIIILWLAQVQLESFLLGKVVMPNTCVDPNDRTRHLLGSTWNSDHCLRCECHRDGRLCCTRYGGIAGKEGCKGVVNPETCEYEFYQLDDPSKPCP